MNIKEAEILSGVSRRNIRFYEQKGLLKPDRNQENDYREYSDSDIETLKLIRALRMLDMPVEQIREVVAGKQPLNDAVSAHKEKLKKRLRELETAIHFCDAFSAENVNIDAVLQKMNEPANMSKLSKRGDRDYAEAITNAVVYLFLGLTPIGIGCITGSLAVVFMMEMPIISCVISLAALFGWACIGYWSGEQEAWLSKALLIHTISAVFCVGSFFGIAFEGSDIAQGLAFASLLGYSPIVATCAPLLMLIGWIDSGLLQIMPMVMLVLSFVFGGIVRKIVIRKNAHLVNEAAF